MRIYVSGPMTGIVDYNFPEFRRAADSLNRAGYEAVDPSRHGVDLDSWGDYVKRDLVDMLTCDAVALLRGWEESRGARLEVHVALELGMPVTSVADWVERAVPGR